MAECKTVANVLQFRHEALSDAARQIRLLSFGQVYDARDLSFTLAAYDLEEAPPFSAISYAWGDPENMECILINGYVFYIRHNCYRALQQAQLHYPHQHIWADSICMNQDDLEEKAVQVARMGSIYSAATSVLSCIGEHDAASRLVEEALELIPEVFPGCSITSFGYHGWHLEDRVLWHKTLRSYSDTYEYNLRTAFTQFAARPYWSRLWIIQEVLAGQDRVDICYGGKKHSWPRLWRLTDLVLCEREESMFRALPCLGGSSETLPPLLDLCLLAAAQRSLTIGQLLGLTRHHHCEKPLDSIYGILGCIRWPESTPVIVPNYSTSSSELACQVIEIWLADDKNHLARDCLQFPTILCQVLATDINIAQSRRGARAQARLAEFRGRLTILEQEIGKALDREPCHERALTGRFSGHAQEDFIALRHIWVEFGAQKFLRLG